MVEARTRPVICASYALLVLIVLLAVLLTARADDDRWIRTNGPTGGRICEIAVDPLTPARLYAAGSPEGLYRSEDGGLSWEMHPFGQMDGTRHVIVDPVNPAVVYTDTQSLSRSDDYGVTWSCIADSFRSFNSVQSFAMDPLDHNTLYAAGRNHDGSGIAVLKTEDGGASWENITPAVPMPTYGSATSIAATGLGRVFVTVNDEQLSSWECGKVFYTNNDGVSWSEVDYGSIGERFVQTVFANPYDSSEIWLSERSLNDTAIPQPLIYMSGDGGHSWSPVTLGSPTTDASVIGASSDGKVYVWIGRLLYTADHGGTTHDVTPPSDTFTYTQFTSLAIHPTSPAIIWLPLWGSGIAYSEDGGASWSNRSQGLSSIATNLIESDPFDPSIVYASATRGEGVYRSEDYGETWTASLNGLEETPFGDELRADPNDDGVIWFASSCVPYLYRSTDHGDTWSRLAGGRELNMFNFCSAYAMGQGPGSDRVYWLDNGYGIVRCDRSSGDWVTAFLLSSEVDYSYSLAVHPSDDDIVFSGYTPKPFQDFAMVRRTLDGGETWDTSLSVPGSSGITSVAIDPSNPSRVYAGSTGVRGEIYRSTNTGGSWSMLNEHFTMLTVWGQPQLIVDESESDTAYVATWLGGTWKTTSSGADWTLLDEAPVSSTSICLSAPGSSTLYSADRTSPKVRKSVNGGLSWQEVADFSADGAFMLNRVIADGATVYAATFGPSIHGGRLYKSSDSGTTWSNITGSLPRSVLDLVVDPSDPNTLYVTTHVHGAYKSTTGGASWTEMTSFPDIGGYDIEVDPVETTILYACGMGGCTVPDWCMPPSGYTFTDGSGVYKSTDSGTTWTQVLTTSNECRAVRLHPSNHHVVFAAAMDDGLQVSNDGGESWTSYNDGLDTTVLTSCAVAGETVYVGTQGCGVYSGDVNTSDWSVTWQSTRSNKPVPLVYSLQVAVDPTNSNRVFVGSNPGGLYRSDDGGVTFYDKNFLTPSVVVDDPYRQGYYTFAINPADTDEVWLGTWGKGIFKSYDGMDFDVPANGATMEMYGKHVNQMAVDSSGIVYAATVEGVYRTTNDGDSWEEFSSGLLTTDVSVISIGDTGEVFAGTRGYGVYQLSGTEWVPQAMGAPWGGLWPIWNDRPRYPYISILPHPDDSSEILIGTFPAGIYKSTDAGATWRESNVGWSRDGVFCLVAHPNSPEIVYAGTYNGVNRSTDFGEHWAMWDDGMPAEQWVFSIALDPRDADVMYACSKNGENEGTGVEGFRGTVMKSMNGGESWYEITAGIDVDQEFYNIIVDPVVPNTLYLAAQRDGMLISEDSGATWSLWNDGLEGQTPGTDGNNVASVLALSSDESTLYFGSAHAGVFRRNLRGTAEPPPWRSNATFRVHESGNVLSDGAVHAQSFATGAADVAEWVSVSTPVDPGDILEFDPQRAEMYRVSSEACSSLVAGVVATEPGIVLGGDLSARETAILALTGIVPVKVTNEGGPIETGDLLVSSSTPGHAMRWRGPGPCTCALVGKALEPMAEDSGTILVLLTAH